MKILILGLMLLGSFLPMSSANAADNMLISSCVNKITKSMRHISAPQACKKTEYLLTWNQKGVQGDVGPQGPAGTNGTSSDNLCTQADLTGSWLTGEYHYSEYPNMTANLGHAYGYFRINVDASGNYVAPFTKITPKNDENGNYIGDIIEKHYGTLLVKVSEPGKCKVEWNSTTEETYANPVDTFPLSKNTGQTILNLNTSKEKLSYVSYEVVPEGTDQDGNIIPEHEVITSEEFNKLLE